MHKMSFWDAIRINKLKSVLFVTLISIITLAFVYVVSLVLLPDFVTLLVIVSSLIIIIQIVTTYYKGSKLVLWHVKAYPLEKYKDKAKITQVKELVEGLSIAAGIPYPKVYVIPSKEINAFATGRNPKTSVIAITEGALELLDREELEGVVAHEISHIKNYDVLFSTIVATFVGFVAIFSEMYLRGFIYEKEKEGSSNWLVIIAILLSIFAPIVVRIIQLAVSREREYLADASAVQLTRYPDGLINALEKIKKYNKGKMKVSEAVSHMFFTDPKMSFLDNIFSTHPPIEKRIERLKNMY